jgi:hypothetical protein
MLGSRIRAALGAASITLLALALVAPAGVAAQGNGQGKQLGHTRKAAMQVCKKGGWKTVEKEDGTRFKNQGRCVSYQVRGGTVTPIERAVTITFALAADTQSCDATGSVEDLGVNQTYAGDLLVDTVAAPQVSITTDSSGEGSTALGTFLTGQSLNLTVDGVTSGDIAVECGVVPI